jgi:hypothetical protein
MVSTMMVMGERMFAAMFRMFPREMSTERLIRSSKSLVMIATGVFSTA